MSGGRNGRPGGDGGPCTPGRAVSIVVPTLREARNIRPLAERVDAALADSGIAWELLLIDDDSGDGSEAVAAALAERLPVRMHVRRGVPSGLAVAVIDGFRLARFDVLAVMDADLSHPPERIPDLLAALDGGIDIALGSRYARGGRIEKGWGLRREANSRIATWLARPLVRCADPMAGFFALRRRALPDHDSLAPIGYKIALELIVRGRLRVGEVPIDFTDRRRGASKMGWREQLNTLRHLGRLYACRFETPARMLRFGLVGLSGLAIDLSVYLGLGLLGMDHRAARFVAYWPAVTWNWRLNRGWTFAERARGPKARQWAAFVVTSGVGLAVNVGSYVALTGLVDALDRHRIGALLLGVAAGAGVNYLAATWWVYRRGGHSA